MANTLFKQAWVIAKHRAALYNSGADLITGARHEWLAPTPARAKYLAHRRGHRLPSYYFRAALKEVCTPTVTPDIEDLDFAMF